MRLENLKVTVIEPHQQLTEVFKRFLMYYFPKSNGTFISDIDTAIEHLQNPDAPKPDFILLDLDTDQERVFEFLTDFRDGTSSWHDVPLITCTVDENPAVEAYLREEIGVSGHLLKPFHVQSLVNLIQELPTASEIS